MKHALLALAVALACVVYELDGEFRVADGWHTRTELERLLHEELREGGVWLQADQAPEAAIVQPAAEEARSPHARTGSVEREQSIRLFGPGVSRRQQIRV